jgi:DNA-binding LacI/PurR family transcriptional regulator
MDAIFVGNDQMALGVMQIAARAGLRIPQELGIVGFDNIPESGFFWPPLTTVEQDQYQVARLAVEQIIKIIESRWDGSPPDGPKSSMLEPSLVVRDSSLRKDTRVEEVARQ